MPLSLVLYSAFVLVTNSVWLCLAGEGPLQIKAVLMFPTNCILVHRGRTNMHLSVVKWKSTVPLLMLPESLSKRTLTSA